MGFWISLAGLEPDHGALNERQFAVGWREGAGAVALQSPFEADPLSLE